MSEDETLSAIIGIRVKPSVKKMLQERAKEEGKTLSEVTWDMVLDGLNVKRQDSDKETIEETIKQKDSTEKSHEKSNKTG